jgi:hypothetical protein
LLSNQLSAKALNRAKRANILTELDVDRIEPSHVQNSAEAYIWVHALWGSRDVVPVKGVKPAVRRE